MELERTAYVVCSTCLNAKHTLSALLLVGLGGPETSNSHYYPVQLTSYYTVKLFALRQPVWKLPTLVVFAFRAVRCSRTPGHYTPSHGR